MSSDNAIFMLDAASKLHEDGYITDEAYERYKQHIGESIIREHDCKYYSDHGGIIGQICNAPKIIKNVVDGSPIPTWNGCRYQRATGWIETRLENRCGNEGRWWHA